VGAGLQAKSGEGEERETKQLGPIGEKAKRGREQASCFFGPTRKRRRGRLSCSAEGVWEGELCFFWKLFCKSNSNQFCFFLTKTTHYKNTHATSWMHQMFLILMINFNLMKSFYFPIFHVHKIHKIIILILFSKVKILGCYNSFFFLEISGTYILVFVQCVPNISLTALIWKLSSFAGSKAQDLLWLPKISLVLQRKWAWPLQPPHRYANFYSNHVGLLDYCS